MDEFPDFDNKILLDVYHILNPLHLTKYDFIDLNHGRDFLKEDKQYDIVVLIYIFVANAEEMKNEPSYSIHNSITRTSELHNKDNWRKRLLTCKAKEILIFGFDSISELTGEYIGELELYKMNIIEFKDSKKIYGRVWRYSKI